GIVDLVVDARPVELRIDVAGGGHDIGTGPEQPGDLVVVGHDRAVEDGVALADRRVLLGLDAGGRHAAQLAGVLTYLGVAIDLHGGELELRISQHLAQRLLADAAGAPLDDAVGHVKCTALLAAISGRSSVVLKPGGASQTSGMAFITKAAVQISPSSA